MESKDIFVLCKEYEELIDKPAMFWTSKDINGFVKFKEDREHARTFQPDQTNLDC